MANPHQVITGPAVHRMIHQTGYSGEKRFESLRAIAFQFLLERLQIFDDRPTIFGR